MGRTSFDIQRDDVYDWEKEIRKLADIDPTRDGQLPLEFLQRFANRVCRDYEMPMIVISKKRGRPGRSFYRHSYSIHLDPWGRNLQTLLHELAHAIAHTKYGTKGHGPVFVRVALELFERYLKIDREEMQKRACKYGVIYDGCKKMQLDFPV